MTATGLIEKQYIIWVKNNFQMGHADYHWGHEPCFYAEKAGQSAAFYGDRTNQTVWRANLRTKDAVATTITGGICITDGAGGKMYIVEKPPKDKKTRYIRLGEKDTAYLYSEDKQSTAWEIARETGIEHPTQKPVELATRAIENSTREGEIVLDLFGGSGTTLIGAELLHRRAYLTELDPRYIDVIVNRYTRITGNVNATCLRDGKEIPYVQLKTENDAENNREPEMR
jgi:DNA modification methylase